MFVLAVASASASALPLTNDGRWKRAFSRSDFRRPEVESAIRDLVQDPNPDEVKAVKVAQFGGDVVPYLVRLSGSRELRFYALDPKGGLFGWFKTYPYQAHAAKALSLIRDPSAAPNLKKILLDPRLGSSAREALVKSDATFTPDEVMASMDADGKNWLASYSVDTYVAMCRGMSPDDAARTLLHLFEAHRLDPEIGCGDYLNVNWLNLQNAHNKPDAIDAWGRLVVALDATGSMMPRRCIHNQLSALKSIRDRLVAPDDRFERLITVLEKADRH